MYMNKSTALTVQQGLAIRPDTDSVHLLTTQHGALHPLSLQRRWFIISNKVVCQ